MAIEKPQVLDPSASPAPATAIDERQGTPSSKKRKLDDALVADSPASIKKSDLWFDDGNVIIQAGDTQFRVHLGMLSRNSGKFKEIVEAGREVGEDGVPLLRIPASASDVDHLLHALYESTYLLKYYHEKKGRLPLSVLMALIRLGNEFGFTQLRSEAANRLYKEYPDDFKKWSRLDRAASTLTLHYLDAEKCPAFSLRLLMLAIECKMYTVLPQIYLDIYLGHSWDEIVNGVQCHDGTRFTLPPAVQVTCLLGFHRLRDKITQVTYSWFQDIPYNNCVSTALIRSDKCKKAKEALYYELFGPKRKDVRTVLEVGERSNDESNAASSQGVKNEDSDSDSIIEMSVSALLSQPSSSFGAGRGGRGSSGGSEPKNADKKGKETIRWRSGWEPWNDRWGANLCHPCAEAAKEAHEAGREELWGMLPELFGLPQWEALADFM